MAVNAEKHGGFFWWMDKNEEGTTMITSPEVTIKDLKNHVKEKYFSIEEVPSIFKTYVEVPHEIIELKLLKLTSRMQYMSIFARTLLKYCISK